MMASSQNVARQVVNWRISAPKIGAIIGAIPAIDCTTARIFSRRWPWKQSLISAMDTEVMLPAPRPCKIRMAIIMYTSIDSAQPTLAAA